MDVSNPDKLRVYKLWKTSVEEVQRFVDDFMSYVVLSEKGISWTRNPQYPAVEVHFNREMGEFIMQVSKKFRATNAPKLMALYKRENFLWHEFRQIFSKCLMSGYRNDQVQYFFMESIFNWFGYCAEVALAFCGVINGSGIKMAADLLSDRLISHAVPVFLRRATGSTLIRCMIADFLLVTETMAHITAKTEFDLEIELEMQEGEAVLAIEDHVILHMESTLNEDCLSALKQRSIDQYHRDKDMEGLKEIERRRYELMQANPWNSVDWGTAIKDTWMFVDDFIAYVVEKHCLGTWKRSKPLSASKYFVADVGDHLLSECYPNEEYVEFIKLIFEKSEFNLNGYPGPFITFATRLLKSGDHWLASIKNLFAFSAHAVSEAMLISSTDGPLVVSNTLARFIIGYVLNDILSFGGYQKIVDLLKRDHYMQTQADDQLDHMSKP